MIRGIAFDLEGTVVDVERAHHDAHLRTAAEIGVHLTFDSALVRVPHFIGGPGVAEEIWALSDKTHPLEFYKKRQREYFRQILETIPIVPRPGFLEVLRSLREKGLQTAIGSLTRTDEALFLLKKSGLDQEFAKKQIVLKEDVQNLKPAPDVFLRTAERMGIPPSEQVVFEDSPSGITSAYAAGSYAAIGMPVYLRKEIIASLVEAGALRIFADWRELNILSLLLNL